MNCKVGIVSGLLMVLCPLGSQGGVEREEIRGAVKARATFDADKVPLSGDIALSLTVEGPQRVEVAPPRPLLSKASSQLWRVREVGLPLVENLENGRQLWKQEFRLSPFVPGPKIEIELAALKVKADGALELEITWSRSLEVEVTTSIAQPDPQSIRPITDVEAAPASPAKPSQQHHWLIVIVVAVGAIATLAVVFFLALRAGGREEPIVYDTDWALRELATARQSGGFARLAEVVRLHIGECFDVAATQLTTAELLPALQLGDRIPTSLADELRAILERCDIAKFTGTVDVGSEADDSAKWIDRAINLVKQIPSVELAASTGSAPE